MSLKVVTRRRDQLDESHLVDELAVRVEKGGALYATRIRPATHGEPMSLRFSGRAGLKTSNQSIEGAAEIVVTKLRLLLLVKSGMNAKGLDSKGDELAIISVDRADLGPPQTFQTMFGKVKRIEFSGVAESFTVRIPYLSNFSQFLEVMAPEYAERLGDAAADELKAAQRQTEAAEQQAARAAEEEKKALNARRFGEAGSRRSGHANPIGGLLDHLATWRYRLSASPDQCISGFVEAFSGSGGLVMKAKWAVKRTPSGAVAVYEGRKGLVVAATLFSRIAQSEEEGAIGSEVRFEIEEAGDGYVICAMWLASRATRMGFTNDGRFFRPYMRAVESRLRQVDASLQLVKD